MTGIEATQKVYGIIMSRYPNHFQATKAIKRYPNYLEQCMKHPSYNVALRLASEFNIPFTISIGE
ncbi:hypothetical protein [Salmonella enterica]|uniref:hypothetical protein n=1 Tax=Salmonella enterica TaxID=28901 RepID=UPI000BA08195|nr:hypothetical protein [Salmonella enterica]EED8424414.1 hypothetical protein [Salmonella enterica subsp. enterica serovar Losangeles]